MRQPNFQAEQELEAAFGEERLQRFVVPYYLKLMAFGAASANARLASEVRARGSELESADIDRLLRMPWRPRVMGTWYAIAAGDKALTDALHVSLATSLGHLTSRPLIVASLMYPTARTRDLLDDYVRVDRADGWGASGLAGAAAARLSPGPVGRAEEHATSAEDVRQLDAMLRFANSLRVN